MCHTSDLDTLYTSGEDFIVRQKKKREIHIHITHPGRIAENKYYGLLDRLEKQKSQSFVFNKDRVLYTAAHIFLRQILSDYASVEPEDWQFTYDDFGKPGISHPHRTNLEFNLSHTHSMIACAVGYQYILGVDIERHRSLDDFESISRLVLSAQERKHLFSVARQVREPLFFRYWTLKEACVKALGKGLTIPLHSIHYQTSGSATWRCNLAKSLEQQGKIYSLYYDLPQGGYSLALAVKLPQTEAFPVIRLFDWSQGKTSCHHFNVLPD